MGLAVFLFCLAQRLVKFGTGVCEAVFTEVLRTLGREDLEVSEVLIHLMRCLVCAVTHPGPTLL